MKEKIVRRSFCCTDATWSDLMKLARDDDCGASRVIRKLIAKEMKRRAKALAQIAASFDKR